MGCSNGSQGFVDRSIGPRTFKGVYVLGPKLGQGSNSEVFQAEEKKSKRKVAVKIVNTEEEQNSVLVKRELEILKTLKHPNILSFIECFEFKDPPSVYLVFELVEGEQLSSRIFKRSFFDEKDANRFASNLLSAVKYIHDKDIVHR